MKNRSQNIGLIFFAIIGILPFVLALSYAVLYSFGVIGVANNGFTFDYWTKVLQDGEIITSFLYSMVIAFISVAVSVGLALYLALSYRKTFEGKFLSFILYLPLAIPGIVASFLALQLLSKSGFLSRIAFNLGLITEARQFPDFVNDNYAIGIILTFITLIMPFFTLLFLNIYKVERVEELTTLAHSLGATPRQSLRKITIPILLSKSKILISLYYIFLLGSYEVPLILGQESPQMLSVMIIREIKQYDVTRLSEGYVVAVIYTVFVSIAVLILFSRFKNIENAE